MSDDRNTNQEKTKDQDIEEISSALFLECSRALNECREIRSNEEVLAQFDPRAVSRWHEAVAAHRRQKAAQADIDRKTKETNRIKLALTATNLPERFRKRFEALDRSLSPEAFDICSQYVQDGLETNGKRGLFLKGPIGTGKTAFSGACIMRSIDMGGPTGRFVNLTRWLQGLRDGFGDDSDADDTIEALANRGLVVLDDLGRQRITGWGGEMLYGLLDALYSNEAHLICTTNATTTQLSENLDEALRSRILQMCHPVVMAGDDLRQTQL
jgi:DNA replication protein DnaC